MLNSFKRSCIITAPGTKFITGCVTQTSEITSFLTLQCLIKVLFLKLQCCCRVVSFRLVWLYVFSSKFVRSPDELMESSQDFQQFVRRGYCLNSVQSEGIHIQSTVRNLLVNQCKIISESANGSVVSSSQEMSSLRLQFRFNNWKAQCFVQGVTDFMLHVFPCFTPSSQESQQLFSFQCQKILICLSIYNESEVKFCLISCFIQPNVQNPLKCENTGIKN